MTHSAFPGFSPRQQIVFALGCVLYALACGGASRHATRQALVAFPVIDPVPAEVGFLIDPPVNANTANHAELQLLPSIGPVLAERILEYRAQHGPFAALEELAQVRGIGPKTIAKLSYYNLIQPD